MSYPEIIQYTAVNPIESIDDSTASPTDEAIVHTRVVHTPWHRCRRFVSYAEKQRVLEEERIIKAIPFLMRKAGWAK
jgi:hypothetical protein